MLVLGGIFLFFAVLLGAFGAHGLEKSLPANFLKTYKTGVTYQFYHALGLLLVTSIGLQLKISFSKTQWAFVGGIVLFSFNCYVYALTGIKFFAMIVPLGGVSFIVGWFLFVWKLKGAKWE